jgi:hypothetical protein
MDERDFQERLLPRVLRLDAAPPDPNVVAAYASGTLPPEERRRLERRIEVDPEAMLLVRALRADRRRANVRRTVAAIAAVVVAAAGVGWAVRRGSNESIDERLVAASARLRHEAPELFAGFEPLRAADLASDASVARGGGAVTWPVGVLLEPPKVLRWALPPGASRAEVSVTGAGTTWSAKVDGTETPLPALEPGTYAVRLRALDALAGQDARSAFAVASPEQAAAHRRALEKIGAVAAPDVADLLRAHYALRHGLFAEARRAAEASRSHADARPTAEAILAHVAARAPGLR